MGDAGVVVGGGWADGRGQGRQQGGDAGRGQRVRKGWQGEVGQRQHACRSLGRLRQGPPSRPGVVPHRQAAPGLGHAPPVGPTHKRTSAALQPAVSLPEHASTSTCRPFALCPQAPLMVCRIWNETQEAGGYSSSIYRCIDLCLEVGARRCRRASRARAEGGGHPCAARWCCLKHDRLGAAPRQHGVLRR